MDTLLISSPSLFWTHTLSFISYFAIMSVTPGPNNVLVTASGAAFGFKRTLPHMLGIGWGHALQTVAIALGLGQLFLHAPWLHVALKSLGTAYLLYLAWRLWHSAVIATPEVRQPIRFVEAALFQFVNPKAWVMALNTVTLFLPSGWPWWLACLYLTVVLVCVNFPCVALWAVCGARLQGHLQKPVGRRLFFGSMAIGLIITGGWMICQ
ncbi:LysE family translocator [Parvibium lacunae]|uniref:LysE family translocator n=1 Tax=Parvibium lacunae TaxID=1888893 RepID=A0A368L437_9BURK|nr:LysE family translocator [Parvibium lacunae]RCS58285.1 LysE family translocator [Parvibium lacunae]